MVTRRSAGQIPKRRGYRPGDRAAPSAGPDPVELSRQRAAAWKASVAASDASEEQAIQMDQADADASPDLITKAPKASKPTRVCHGCGSALPKRRGRPRRYCVDCA